MLRAPHGSHCRPRGSCQVCVQQPAFCPALHAVYTGRCTRRYQGAGLAGRTACAAVNSKCDSRWKYSMKAEQNREQRRNEQRDEQRNEQREKQGAAWGAGEVGLKMGGRCAHAARRQAGKGHPSLPYAQAQGCRVTSSDVLLDACHSAVHQLVPQPGHGKGAAHHRAGPHQQAQQAGSHVPQLNHDGARVAAGAGGGSHGGGVGSRRVWCLKVW